MDDVGLQVWTSCEREFKQKYDNLGYTSIQDWLKSIDNSIVQKRHKENQENVNGDYVRQLLTVLFYL